jgi:hypothetical protein
MADIDVVREGTPARRSVWGWLLPLLVVAVLVVWWMSTRDDSRVDRGAVHTPASIVAEAATDGGLALAG